MSDFGPALRTGFSQAEWLPLTSQGPSRYHELLEWGDAGADICFCHDFAVGSGDLAVMAAMDKILDNSDCIDNPCRCCRFRVPSAHADHTELGRCSNVTISGKVVRRKNGVAGA